MLVLPAPIFFGSIFFASTFPATTFLAPIVRDEVHC
jgi:hypothetical protein